MTDVERMTWARTLEARGRGLTSPNPMVDAIVVSAGAMLADRFHARAGAAHAEAAALAEAGERARGTTLYVTLEPCNHVGRTPPCVDAIIRAGIRRVVSATPDPNPRVKGGGAATLVAAGIEVATPCLERAARELNRAFFTAVERQRPHVTAKWADRKSTRLNSSHLDISYAVFCLDKKNHCHQLPRGISWNLRHRLGLRRIPDQDGIDGGIPCGNCRLHQSASRMDHTGLAMHRTHL